MGLIDMIPIKPQKTSADCSHLIEKYERVELSIVDKIKNTFLNIITLGTWHAVQCYNFKKAIQIGNIAQAQKAIKNGSVNHLIKSEYRQLVGSSSEEMTSKQIRSLSFLMAQIKDFRKKRLDSAFPTLRILIHKLYNRLYDEFDPHFIYLDSNAVGLSEYYLQVMANNHQRLTPISTYLLRLYQKYKNEKDPITLGWIDDGENEQKELNKRTHRNLHKVQPALGGQTEYSLKVNEIRARWNARYVQQKDLMDQVKISQNGS